MRFGTAADSAPTRGALGAWDVDVAHAESTTTSPSNAGKPGTRLTSLTPRISLGG